jgi:D-serine deaminase-like pyridoxal phosphate-dependent protein
MALSRDRGTAAQAVDQGYGLVCDVEGRVCHDLIVGGANQEHGIVTVRPGSQAPLPDWPIGTLLRILPNHACATAAQFSAYEVLREDPTERLARWPRFSGW